VSLSKRDWRSVREIARDKLNFASLRPGQKAALEAVLQGQDTLVVLPTGSGKSAVYQIAGALIPGPTVVVSPLIALQRDQREAIAESELGQVAVVNSLEPAREREQALAELEQQELEFLFLAPEQLKSEETLARLRRAKPSLFVVDEAHCISEWGHGFRPDYLRLGAVIDELGHPRTLALTATASAEVRREICERLHLRDPKIIVTGFDRPNIHLAVRCVSGDALKLRVLGEEISKLELPGIVYAATRKHAETVAGSLVERGYRALGYHAGLKRDERNARQEAFMSGQADVIVATTAFGMGIDKPDVRFVIHYHASDSLDAYYQEIGRAGRDGEPAHALLLFSERDLDLRRFFAGSGRLSVAEVESVLGVLREQQAPLGLDALARAAGLSRTKTSGAVARLEDQGVLERAATGEASLSRLGKNIATRIARAVGAQEQLRERQRERVEAVRAYARARTCRRALLLEHFGDRLTGECTGCDNCDERRALADERATPARTASKHARAEPDPNADHAGPFPLRSRVLHKTWGKGTVIGYEGAPPESVIVDFDFAGEQRLALDSGRAEPVLEPAS